MANISFVYVFTMFYYVLFTARTVRGQTEFGLSSRGEHPAVAAIIIRFCFIPLSISSRKENLNSVKKKKTLFLLEAENTYRRGI